MEAVIEQLSDYELEPQRRTGNKPIPTLNHAYVQNAIGAELRVRYRKTHTFLSELNLTMPTKPDAVPDICVYPKLQIDFLNDVTSMTEMPLTAIEIVSPSQPSAEVLVAFKRYFEAGVQSCWLVMPSFQAVLVYSAVGKYRFFTEHDTLTDAATGIELPLADVFA
jgi:Uma2 family endonuclease